MSYSQEVWTICEKINIFYSNDGVVEALLLDGNIIKRSCTIVND